MDVFRMVERAVSPRRRHRLPWLGLLGSAAAGAGAMFLLDPDRGARRRSLLRDKSVHALHRTGAVLDKGARDFRYRSRGLVAETRRWFRPRRVPDEVLRQRVRSKLGRLVSHPHAVEVDAHDGRVILRGPVLRREADELLAGVAAVPGVVEVGDQVEIHDDADGVPALQGASRRTGERFELMQESWAPVTRLVMAALGASLALYGIARRGRLGTLAAALGAIVLVRDVTNRPLKRLLGIGVGRRAVDFQKTVRVAAPVDDVFEFWMNFENFPRFMSHIREVERLGEGRYRWVAVGPAGIPVRWDGELTEVVPNRLIAWKSAPGAAVANAGIARFDANPDGSTRLDIRMSYNPPAGALGHVIASIFGSDPKHAMDEDLVRFQSLLERGKTTAHGEEVRFAELLTKP